MIDNYEPREGDRVLVTYVGCDEGGATAKVMYDGRVGIDGYTQGWVPFADVTVLQLLHRPAPPRPQVESFTRSDGAHVDWLKRTRRPLVGRVITPEDADLYATMYGQVAEQMRWDAEYGEKP